MNTITDVKQESGSLLREEFHIFCITNALVSVFEYGSSFYGRNAKFLRCSLARYDSALTTFIV